MHAINKDLHVSHLGQSHRPIMYLCQVCSIDSFIGTYICVHKVMKVHIKNVCYIHVDKWALTNPAVLTQ